MWISSSVENDADTHRRKPCFFDPNNVSCDQQAPKGSERVVLRQLSRHQTAHSSTRVRGEKIDRMSKMEASCVRQGD